MLEYTYLVLYSTTHRPPTLSRQPGLGGGSRASSLRKPDHHQQHHPTILHLPEDLTIAPKIILDRYNNLEHLAQRQEE